MYWACRRDGIWCKSGDSESRTLDFRQHGLCSELGIGGLLRPSWWSVDYLGAVSERRLGANSSCVCKFSDLRMGLFFPLGFWLCLNWNIPVFFRRGPPHSSTSRYESRAEILVRQELVTLLGTFGSTGVLVIQIHFFFSLGHSRRRIYTIYIDANSNWRFVVFDVSTNSKFTAAKFIKNNANFQTYIRVWSTLFL